MDNWYAKRYRRHLCDMHVNDWDDQFLSRFDPEEYVRNLETAHVNMPMIYLQSHIGLCYFPTKTARMHRAFINDPGKMRRLVELCREKGMRVVGYYSMVYNRLAEDEHPDWAMRHANGRTEGEENASRYGLVCPNNKGYREFVFAQIREMLEYFPVDGLFFDMPFWPHVCYCDKCRKRWANEEGGTIPTDKCDPRWERSLQVRRSWMGEFVRAVHDCAKSIRPEVAVEMNFAGAVAFGADEAIGDEVNEVCDYTGGDLYGGLLAQSFTCKYYYSATKNRPFEYMTARCPTLMKHTVSLTPRELDTAVMLTAAHHGASLIIDAIDPVGTMDSRVYRAIGDTFEKQIPYEKYFTGDQVCDIGVFYHLPAKALRHGQTFSNHDCALETVKKLIAAHVPVGVVTVRQMAELEKYPVLMLPYVHSFTDEERAAIVRYVENGGRLYMSGAEDPALVKALLGADVEGMTEHTYTYIAPIPGEEALFCGFDEKYPLPAEECVPVLKNLSAEAKVLAHVNLPYTVQGTRDFASIHSNPPGVMTDIPSVVLCKVGKGYVLWCGAPIERETQRIYEDVLLSLLARLGLEARVTTSAARVTELVTFAGEGFIRVSAVRLNSDFEGDLPAYTVRVKCPEPKKVVLLPAEEIVPHEYADGYVTFEARTLDLFDMYEIRL